VPSSVPLTIDDLPPPNQQLSESGRKNVWSNDYCDSTECLHRVPIYRGVMGSATIGAFREDREKRVSRDSRPPAARKGLTMAGINYRRVLLGGLAGGVVANACDFVIGILMADDSRRMAQRLNLDWDVVTSPGVAITWATIDFVYATLIIWTYAAIRPRFGPGRMTAITAGMMIFGASTLILLGFQQMGVFTPDMFTKSAFLSLITAVLVALTGSAIYREE